MFERNADNDNLIKFEKIGQGINVHRRFLKLQVHITIPLSVSTSISLIILATASWLHILSLCWSLGATSDIFIHFIYLLLILSFLISPQMYLSICILATYTLSCCFVIPYVRLCCLWTCLNSVFHVNLVLFWEMTLYWPFKMEESFPW